MRRAEEQIVGSSKLKAERIKAKGKRKIPSINEINQSTQST